MSRGASGDDGGQTCCTVISPLFETVFTTDKSNSRGEELLLPGRWRRRCAVHEVSVWLADLFGTGKTNFLFILSERQRRRRLPPPPAAPPLQLWIYVQSVLGEIEQYSSDRMIGCDQWQ